MIIPVGLLIPQAPIFLPAGNIVVFSGAAELSQAIEVFSHSILSHAAMVLPADVLVDGKPQTETHIIESTQEAGHSGPQINTLAATWATYPKGSRYWNLSLAANIRTFLDWKTLWDLATRKLHGDSYNVLELGQYVLRDLPFITYLPQIREANSHEEVCSEFIAELLRAGGLPGLNPPLISPGILASLRIYSGIEQLGGPPATIKNFNTV